MLRQRHTALILKYLRNKCYWFSKLKHNPQIMLLNYTIY